MAVPKTKIVLDADVIIHFAKGGKLDLLPRIFCEFRFVVLDIVKREIPDLLLPMLMHLINKEKSITEEVLVPAVRKKRNMQDLQLLQALLLAGEKVPV